VKEQTTVEIGADGPGRWVFAAGLLAWIVGCQGQPARQNDAGTGRGGSVGADAANVADATVVPDVASTGDAGLGADSGGDGTCNDRSYVLSTLAPEILIVLDRSGSMNNDENDQTCVGGCPISKWTETTASINETVQETQSAIRWALKFFPTTGMCGVSAGVTVAPGLEQATVIANALAQVQATGATPTQLALTSALTALESIGTPNPKYVLLATDGLPTCGTALNPTTPDSAAAIAAVSSLAAAGIPTFVVGVGAVPTAQDTLTQMAVAGGRARSGGTAYYAASDPGSLIAALSTIAASTISCSFALPAAADPTHITVRATANDVIPMDATDGWIYSAADQSIVLTGSWCDKMRAGTLVTVDVDIGC